MSDYRFLFENSVLTKSDMAKRGFIVGSVSLELGDLGMLELFE